MGRVVKAPDERRNEFIATANQLFYTKGYESTSIKDIVTTMGVAKGTFYHYFDSKTAVLEAIVEQAAQQTEAILQEIVADDSLSAIPKWNKAMQATGKWKVAHKAELREVARMMMSDKNILLQHKLRTELLKKTAVELAKIIEQGVQEGVFTTTLIAESADLVMVVMASLSETIAELWLNPDQVTDPVAVAVRKHTAVQTAIERILGAPSGSLPIIDRELIMAWFSEDVKT